MLLIDCLYIVVVDALVAPNSTFALLAHGHPASSHGRVRHRVTLFAEDLPYVRAHNRTYSTYSVSYTYAALGKTFLSRDIYSSIIEEIVRNII